MGFKKGITVWCHVLDQGLLVTIILKVKINCKMRIQLVHFAEVLLVRLISSKINDAHLYVCGKQTETELSGCQ